MYFEGRNNRYFNSQYLFDLLWISKCISHCKWQIKHKGLVDLWINHMTCSTTVPSTFVLLMKVSEFS